MVKALNNDWDSKGHAYIFSFSSLEDRFMTENNTTSLLILNLLACPSVLSNKQTLCKSNSFGSVRKQSDAGGPRVLLKWSVKLSAIF